MDQQGTSTPDGATAADPQPRKTATSPAGTKAAGQDGTAETPQEMAREIAANVPGQKPPDDLPEDATKVSPGP